MRSIGARELLGLNQLTRHSERSEESSLLAGTSSGVLLLTRNRIEQLAPLLFALLQTHDIVKAVGAQ